MRTIFSVVLLTCIPLSTWAAPQPDAEVRLNYTLHCMGCHKSDGSGHGDYVPAMKGNLGRFLRVPGGREYLVRVPGTAQSLLGSRETAELLNWALREFDPDHVPADFEPYTEKEIAHLRQQPLSAPSIERNLLIEALRTIKTTAPPAGAPGVALPISDNAAHRVVHLHSLQN